MKHTQPFFSIIISTYNRPQELKACLESLTKLNYPRDCFEVIVVDDGSEKPLRAIIDSLRNQMPLKFIQQANGGCGVARNTGAKEAKGQYLAFTDDDCTHPPDWLENLALRFVQTPNAMIGGKTVNILQDNVYSTASQLLMDYLFSYYNAEPENAHYLNSIALPAKAFHDLGGFCPDFFMSAEDRDLCDRWLSQGYPMIYSPEVLIYHAHYLTLASLWRQQFNYGRGAYHFQKIYAQRHETKGGMQPLSFYRNLLAYPFSVESTQPKLLLSALFFLSQVAITVGLFWEKARYK